MIKLKDLLKEDKFIAFYKKDKVTVNAKSLWDAKKQIIAKLKVPKKDVGLVSVLNKTEYDKQKFRFEGKLNEGVDFRVTVEDRKGKLIQGGNFTLKSDANLYIKDMMKKHKLKREKGFWGNRKTGVEMSTNF
jgi:hypothetical protein